MKTTRRYVSEDTYKDVMAWAAKMFETGLFYKNPRSKGSFPFYLNEYIKYLKK
jgi:hypothetical protein